MAQLVKAYSNAPIQEVSFKAGGSIPFGAGVQISGDFTITASTQSEVTIGLADSDDAYEVANNGATSYASGAPVNVLMFGPVLYGTAGTTIAAGTQLDIRSADGRLGDDGNQPDNQVGIALEAGGSGDQIRFVAIRR